MRKKNMRLLDAVKKFKEVGDFYSDIAFWAIN
jgi:hypothetical protein